MLSASVWCYRASHQVKPSLNKKWRTETRITKTKQLNELTENRKLWYIMIFESILHNQSCIKMESIQLTSETKAALKRSHVTLNRMICYLLLVLLRVSLFFFVAVYMCVFITLTALSTWWVLLFWEIRRKCTYCLMVLIWITFWQIVQCTVVHTKKENHIWVSCWGKPEWTRKIHAENLVNRVNSMRGSYYFFHHFIKVYIFTVHCL